MEPDQPACGCLLCSGGDAPLPQHAGDGLAGLGGVKPIWGLDEIVANLTRWDARWGPAVVPYSFYEARPAHLSNNPDYSGFTAFTPEQREATRLALSLITDVVNLQFVEVADDGSQPGPGNPRLTFATSTSTAQYFTAYASVDISDGMDLGDAHRISSAELMFNLLRWSGPVQPGVRPFSVLMHEIMHGLGVPHPGKYNRLPGQEITYGEHAEYAQDSAQFTVMSYFGAEATGSTALAYPNTPLLHDIAALQSLYGANMSTRAGDTVYGYNSTAGRALYDFSVNPKPAFAIWDAGGIDTLDFTQTNLAVNVDLAPGAFSDAFGGTNNISIAFGVVVENAAGGTSGDVVRGNTASNVLHGHGGNDVLDGRGGDDLLDGGAGADTLLGAIGVDALQGGAGDDRLEGGDGDDDVRGGLDNDNVLGGADRDVLYGDGGWDNLEGGAGDDVIFGGTNVQFDADGGDTLWGGDGDDRLQGNTGDDHINGEAGRDYARGGGDHDVLSGGLDNDELYGDRGRDTLRGGDGDDVIFGNTNVQGDPDDADRLEGGAGADFLQGNLGLDELFGGDGADTLRGGADSDIVLGEGGDDVVFGDRGPDQMRGGAGNDIFAWTGLDDGSIAGSGADLGQVDRILDWGAAAGDDDRIDLALAIYSADDYDESGLVALTMEQAIAEANLLLSDGDKVGVVGFQDPGGASGVLAFWDMNGDGADTLRGGADSDIVLGEGGDDVIFGDRGPDQVRGGAGNDIFAWTGLDDGSIAGSGADFSQVDRILDWGAAAGDDDRIDLALSSYSAADYDESDLVAFTMEQAIAEANLLLSDGDKVGVVQFQDGAGATGVLAFWDMNGDGVADQVLRIDNITIAAIGAGDFF